MRRSHSIRNVMLRNFALSALVPTLVLSVLVYGLSLSMVVRQAKQTNLAALELTGQSIQDRLEGIVDNTSRLPSIGGTSSQYSSNSLYSLLLNYDTESESIITSENYQNYLHIRSMVNQSFLRTSSYISAIYVLMPNGAALTFSGDFTLQRENVAVILDSLKDISLPAFVGAGMNSAYTKNTSLRSCLTYFFPVKTTDSKETLAVLAIDMNTSVFSALTEFAGGYNASVQVCDGNGNILYSSGGNLQNINASGDSFSVYNWKSGCVVCACTLPENVGGFRLIASVDIDLFEKFEPSLVALFAVTVLMIAYVLFSTLLNTKRFARPVIRMSEQMIAADRLPDEITVDSDIQEYRALGDRYNEMLTSISSYINQKYANEMLLMRAKMQAMDAQIDSHFLYNTLECIYTMALLDGANDVARVVKSLSDTLRYISKSGDGTVTVRQELNYVQAYIAIQQARLGDDVNCVFSVDENILDSKMLKLSLQPLVENAFKHGFASGQRPYILHISGECRGDTLVFSVRDNGVGMTEEKLENLRAQIQNHSQSECVGLANVAERLRVYYGNQASLQVESVFHHGTLVTMLLPEGAVK